MSPCPICKAPVSPRSENRAHPFCSPRCRQIDLGKWLDEEYRIAGADASSSDAEESAGATQHPHDGQRESRESK